MLLMYNYVLLIVTLNLRRGSRIGILQCAMPMDVAVIKLVRI